VGGPVALGGEQPGVEQDEPDKPDRPAPPACAGRPTLSISSPEASRSDATVDFEVSLSCITIGTENRLGLALAWNIGLASDQAQGNVNFTD